MGMFDTVYFDKPYLCPNCRAKIESTQTKAFERTLANFHVKDCVSHAEEIRVIKEELFCNKCSEVTGRYVYLAVFRGILVGVGNSLQRRDARLGCRRQRQDRDKTASCRHLA